MASTTYHAQLIKYDSSGNQSILNLKNTGDDVSISRNSNGNLPSTVTSAQTLANAFGSLAFKSAVTWNDVSGLASTELTVSSEGKLADARAIKALNDKIATNASNITKLNSNLAYKADSSTVNNIEQRLSSIESTGTPDISGKANRYKSHSVTLYYYSWYGSSAPYTYTVSVNGVTSTNDVQVILNSTSSSVASAWMNAAIVNGTQSTNSITLYAYGKKPASNIPITVLVGDEVIS